MLAQSASGIDTVAELLSGSTTAAVSSIERNIPPLLRIRPIPSFVVDGGEKEGQFGGQKGASFVVTLWR
jgi:hypothetical protein